MHTFVQRVVATVVVCLALVGVRPRDAHGQTPHQLVPIVTDQMPIPLSSQFGIPSEAAINDAGDYAFIGTRGTGLYYRKAGKASATRVIQYGDEVPGLPGSRLGQLFAPLVINASGVVAVRADVQTTSRITNAILTFDGTTLRTVVTGFDTAPGTGGLKFERTIGLVGFNDNSTALFSATMLPAGSTSQPIPTLFVAPAAGPIVRVAGIGDAAPGTGGTFTGINGNAINASGQVLFQVTITGGSGTSALIVWTNGSLRKVAANGDPNPLGGTFTDGFQLGSGVNPFLNDAGLVVFRTSDSLFENTEANGTTAAVAVNSAAPAVIGGTFSSVTAVVALSDGGDAVFLANVSAGSAASGLFRYRSGQAVDAVSYAGQAVPSTPGRTFASWGSVSVNATGTVSFQGNAVPAPNVFQQVGIFQKTAAGTLVRLLGQSTGTNAPGGGVFQLPFTGFPTQTIASGAVLVRTHIADGQATHGHFLVAGTAQVLMLTTDPLPAGARRVVRPFFLSTGGDFVGVLAFFAGGRESVAVWNPVAGGGAIAGTEGDQSDFIANARLMLGAITTVQVNANGLAAFQSNMIGSGISANRNVILVGGVGQSFHPVVIDGNTTDTAGRLLSSVNFPASRPIAINAQDQVAFTAIVNGGSRGVFVGSLSSAPQKVAIVGDLVSTGQAITSVATQIGGINDAGQVVFGASTAAGAGIFVAAPGQTPVKIVQVGDAAPGGGTFSAVGASPQPGFNNLGQVAFVATVAGGAGGGIFLGSTSGAPSAIVLNGAASPAGGVYSITSVLPDVVLNDAGDIAFVATLTGGAADSGVFVRRGPLAPVVVAAKQGDNAPGTAGVFTTFLKGPNSLVGEMVQVSSTGQVSFRGSIMPPGQPQTVGYWHLESSGAVQPILIVPSADPAFLGGTVASLASITGWLGGGRIPMYAPLANGPTGGGLFLYTPVAAAATGTGSSVAVTPTEAVGGTTPVTVTFSNVLIAGGTTLTRGVAGPPVPREYTVGFSGAYYNLTTTATVSGSISVCIDFSDLAFPAGAVLRLLHYVNNAWVDITSGPPAGSVICGTATSLSPFAVVQALNETLTNIVVNGTFSNGATGWLQFATDNTGAQDNSYISWSVNNGVFEYFRVPPPSGSNSAVVLQNTSTGFSAGDGIVARFDIGNSSTVRKRISVLIHASNFSDLAVCTFWLPPNAPMRTYAMRTRTTIAWTTASISFYAASAGANGGAYQLDNVVMGPGPGLSDGSPLRTDCVDALAPVKDDTPDGQQLLTNGNFSAGLSGWTAFGTITAQVTGGVAEFIRPANTAPSGVLLQPSGSPIDANQTVTARFDLGNSSGVRKRITVLIHDFNFVDLAACTFFLEAGQPLSTYTIRTYATIAWPNATISFYPATTDTAQWFRLDNVSLSATPAATTYGADCVEPGGELPIGSSTMPAGVSFRTPALPGRRDPGVYAPVPSFAGATGIRRIIGATLRRP